MATDLSTEYTLLDLMKGHDPDGNVAKIINTLWTHGDMIKDAKWYEANDFTSHQVTQTLYEPAGEFGIVNKGVSYAAAKTTQIREDIAILETYSRIDERHLRRARDPEMYRSQRNMMVIRGMTKTFNSTILYSNRDVAPEKINGFLNRFTTLAALTAAPSGKSAGGASAGAVTSIYAIRWGEDGVYCCYPRNGSNAIVEEDLGRQLMQPSSTTAYTAVVSHFAINFGLCIADPRCFQRICNIEPTGAANIFNEDDLIDVLENMPDLNGVVIYVPKAVKVQMMIALKNKTNVNYTVENAWGTPTLHFYGAPVRRLDQILTTEAVVA